MEWAIVCQLRRRAGITFSGTFERRIATKPEHYPLIGADWPQMSVDAKICALGPCHIVLVWPYHIG
jgi:hypothetical protein